MNKPNECFGNKWYYTDPDGNKVVHHCANNGYISVRVVSTGQDCLTGSYPHLGWALKKIMHFADEASFREALEIFGQNK